MNNYEKLIKRLRTATTLPVMNTLCQEAADVIEELQKAVNFHKFNSEFWEDKYNSLADEKWIPVTERLPLEAGKYLVCGRWKGKQTEIWICEFMALGSLKGWANNATNPSVTHWQPLPEPPKEE